MPRKVVSKKPTTVKKVVDEDEDYPNKYQKKKGVQYLRPLHFAATPEGVMAWVPDVDNYPDSN
jgi:hypothetical protein